MIELTTAAEAKREPTLDDVLADVTRCDRIEARSSKLHDETAAILRERPGDEMTVILAWLARLDARLTEAENRVIAPSIQRINCLERGQVERDDRLKGVDLYLSGRANRLDAAVAELCRKMDWVTPALAVQADVLLKLVLQPDSAPPMDAVAPAEVDQLKSASHEAPEDAWPVVVEILRERLRQMTKWGEQNHPTLPPTVDDTRSAIRELGIPTAEEVRREYAADVEAGDTNWARILLEEFAEAIEEAGKLREGAPEASVAALREEVVQVAGVAVAWVESIDRAAAKSQSAHGAGGAGHDAGDEA